MNQLQEFDLLRAPLHGKSLIEASAGTGKTFAISRIFLRLLLERQLKAQQILVVTFTEAATNELKDRIQHVLLGTRAAFDGKKIEDHFIQDYVAQHPDPAKATALLTAAIQDFDEAAIFTIHKFCNRVLQEQAFESGGLFDTELVTEQTSILRQVVKDFWRKHITDESGLFLRYALAKLSIKSLFSLIEGKIGMVNLKVVPDVTPEDCSHLEQAFSQSYQRVQETWPAAKRDVTELLSDGRLRKNIYSRNSVKGFVSSMDAYTMTVDPNPAVFDKFEKFTATAIERDTKNAHKGNLPQHPFFDVCEEHFENYQKLRQPYDRRVIWLKRRLFEYARTELMHRKEVQNIFYFDDLLLKVYAALQVQGQGLAASVREKYHAALIDEFQDTDPLQYDIFHQIFDQEDGTLFLIGDPKQAIYGFRGADIFAYMTAKEQTPPDARFTLSTNYRSAPNLISAINAIFAQENAFLYDEIPFQRARAAGRQDPVELVLEEMEPSPLQLWFVDPAAVSAENRKLDRDEAKEFIIQSVAAEIVRLLNAGRLGRATLDGRPLEEKHIAVLVRSNAEAQRVQQVLKQKGINSVLYSTASLFAAREAGEVQRLLAAVAHPRQQRLVKAALVTEMIGVPGEKLLETSEDDAEIASYFTRFARYHTIWQTEGFVRMFRAVLDQEGVVARLMTFADGERRVTNLLHLSDVLNSASQRRNLGMAGLLAWLKEQRDVLDRSVEAHQIRLESDENAIKLLTMHMSKGLQYPVVFCPFTWGASSPRRGEPYEFHDEADDYRHTLDLALSDTNRSAAECEILAENLRLLYVALTRARSRCYLVWGPLSGHKSSAPAYLLHPPPVFDVKLAVQLLYRHVGQLKRPELLARVEQLAHDSGGSIAVRHLQQKDAEDTALAPVTDARGQLNCRTFSSAVDTAERISSYTGLVSRQPHASELADHDPSAITKMTSGIDEEIRPDFSDFRNFPKGARTGSFIHHVFQNISFSPNEQSQREEVIATKLVEFGYEREWQNAVLGLIGRVLRQPLSVAGDTMRFLDVPNERRLNEMEFYFPVDDVSPKGIQTCFEPMPASPYGAAFMQRLSGLQFRQFHGFMKGFIDLIFEQGGRYYIVDWKSNFLGLNWKKYDSEVLARAMVSNLYILQYHIYVLALDRYLRQRLHDYDYERHFGGVFYIFLRGVQGQDAPNSGVFADKPASGLISRLDKEIAAPANALR